MPHLVCSDKDVLPSGRRQKGKDPEWAVASALWLFTEVFPGISSCLWRGEFYVESTGLALKPRGWKLAWKHGGLAGTGSTMV